MGGKESVIVVLALRAVAVLWETIVIGEWQRKIV